ncbi:hypothetical protein COU87_03910 [Candidatus Roizmanbacteria bacterium CG10_big_fil_rev_8_21_14_0_10_39_12]|uniref:Mannosyl-glycoprotein endo-beta-N-acetylglucosamidase-like domain-containing protein n=1 Tax=Candidatus Roizmanbacteria bacterium CG10_big_fil_rev_8_21_14_0_10_39_12 TaxID=1974852 RepID=A0A2M8KNS1_9BACT|nr:MAG: hypothetical protein COY15_01910 [Candidatus Roizmanbacteria bacterium CG_4_10_14_0_2_um_filter_39_12]PJE61572.1 MAG: hypothetical protein COU87_03910 [Candidatus Roizmanbacteria bacterium CG10_big_fil_rev_8_21_14_0_10_39_12]
MGKIFLYIFLIVLLLYPSDVFASKEAGSSASLIQEVQESSIDEYVEKSVKRMVIQIVLEKYNAPLSSEVDGFMNACTNYNLDCYLLPSIAGLESSFGKFTYPESHNPFGWGGGHIMFESWEDGFMTVAKGLSERYVARGADTIETIGPIYAASPTWAQRVRYFHNEFERVEREKTNYFRELTLTK